MERPVPMGIWTFLNPLNWFGRKRNGLRLRVRAELYDGDIHPVVDVEGVGPAYERQLAAVGILNTDQLLAHPAAAVAAAIDTPEKRVRSWQAMAELAVVDGIGPQYAEALARGGVDGIRDLVSRDAKVIASEVNAHLDSLGVTVTGGTVSETRIRTWQEAAQTLKRRRVTVRLFGDALPPVSKQALRDRRSEPNGHTNQGRTNSVRATTTSVPTTTGRAPAAKPTTRKTTRTAAPRSASVRKATATSTAATTAASRCAATTAAGSPCKRASRDGSKYCASHKGFRAPAKTAAKKTAPVTVRKTPAGTTTVTTRAAAKSTAAKSPPRATAPATTTRKPTAKAAPKTAPKTAKTAPRTTRSTGKTPAVKTTTTRTVAKTPAVKTTTTRTVAKTPGRVHVTHNGYRLYQKGNRFYFSKKSQAEVRPDGAEPVYELPRNREIKVTQNGLPVLKGKA